MACTRRLLAHMCGKHSTKKLRTKIPTARPARMNCLSGNFCVVSQLCLISYSNTSYEDSPTNVFKPISNRGSVSDLLVGLLHHMDYALIQSIESRCSAFVNLNIMCNVVSQNSCETTLRSS